MPTNHLLIRGKVQGVFFRATAKKLADKYGLRGWIKNSKEGNVEATISGREDQLKLFINWCKQGPDKALVEEVIVIETVDMIFNDFKVIK
ncbi:MAG: acylphosphatase [Ginsengibacter sp.]